jgi:hypothetical protein
VVSRKDVAKGARDATVPNAISGLALCRGLDAQQVSRLAALHNRKSVPIGERVIDAEEMDEAVYIVLWKVPSRRVSISRWAPASP